jgi:DNA-binding transcriptional regulator YbjK
MTYHFTGMSELLHEAFTRFSVTFSDRFAARMEAAADREAAIVSIIEAVEGDILSDQRELVLTQELYTLAARDASFRDITNAWMGRSRAALERRFDPTTSRMLDALIEGLTLHRALDTESQDDALVRLAVARITDIAGSGETP